ncbi:MULTISPECIES: biliverdin-producing heme oxygenase [Rhodopseudomonas]|uniref:heme oxygenase (biliverdin-producing) n=1 Tax=Rhodopseudomonas palustris TaxID=1076 RepID=A0A0D7F1Q9_RHOPL|nr:MULTISPECIES: biliverdin-producing heme oxygenase [Rhodopseudomonas]KIZ47043.1 heme oxygenase [Rhodopseudomonas palustris]MDF3813372.1 biliverdin-producing heme oxygenase [Rhodopseudomonas sp. BAL398]WOK20383.1 biliverdin-producing heme oxygenase [Rhodopseudomonas sp. BAL398]
MAVGSVNGVAPASVVSALYLRTKALHLEAEKSGIISDILHGAASRESYALLLRNLHAAYREIEAGIARHRDSRGLAPLAAYKLDRTSAIESDLTALCGADWARTIPLLPTGEAYARRVAEVAQGDGARLIAHAYTRYLGDLNGGSLLARLLAKTLGMQPDELSLYDFSGVSDPATLKNDYRQALEQAGAAAADPGAIIEEGALAFSLNIALSVAVQLQAQTGATALHAQ